MLRRNLLQRVSNAAEASYFLLHRWPSARGPAYLAARNACYLAALGRMSADDCRRAFAGALAEAGMSNLEELSEAEGAGPTGGQDVCPHGVSPSRPIFPQKSRPGRGTDKPDRKKGHVGSTTGTKASASSAHLKEPSRDLTVPEAGRALQPMREQQEPATRIWLQYEQGDCERRAGEA